MFLNFCMAILFAICRSSWVISSPLIDPNVDWKVDPSDEVPRKTKGNAHAAITINSLGPVKKFLSESIIVVTL